MADEFIIAPAPKWYFHDSEGRLAAFGTMETFKASNHSVQYPIYTDPGGLVAYPNPLDLDGTGGTPVPMYWKLDGTELYYVVIREFDPSGNKKGNIIATIDNYPAVTVSGGGAPITITTDVENHIVNGNFHITGDTQFGGITNSIPKPPISPVPEGTLRVAPGSSTIDTQRPAGAYIGGSVIDSSGKTVTPNVLPGWLFIKAGGASLDDTIDFPVSPPGDLPPAGPTANAPRYFRYKTTNALSTTELDLTYIIPGARSFSDETIQISFDARADGPTPPTQFIFEQVFGTGGTPSAIVPTSANFTFPNAQWQRLFFSMSIPSVSGKTFGTNFDDFIRLRWRIPENTVGEFFLTNLQIQRGASLPAFDFIYQSYNQTLPRVLADLISGHLPKTGDTKFSIDPNPSIGWIVIDKENQTLGSVASGATFQGEETRNLYKLIYAHYNNTNAPVSGGRTGNSDNDFDADKTITFPEYYDRVIGAVNAARVLVETKEGSRTHSLTVAQLAAHTHTTKSITNTVGTQPGGNPAATNTGTFTDATGTTGSGTPFEILQPTSYMFLHVKL